MTESEMKTLKYRPVVKAITIATLAMAPSSFSCPSADTPKVSDISKAETAENWEDILPELIHENFSTRVKAQKVIEARLKLFSTRGKLEHAMNTMLIKYSHANDPELKQRLLTIMKGISGEYRASIGTPMVGIIMRGGSKRLDDKEWAVVEVTEVRKDSPADKAGLLPGDLIFTVANYDLRNDFSVADNKLNSIVDGYAPGEELKMDVLRNREEVAIKLTLGNADTYSGSKKATSLLAKVFDKNSGIKGQGAQLDPMSNNASPSLKEKLKFPIELPKRFEDNSFFTRWFKRHAKQ